jgi:hypothetical protein
MTAGPKPKLRPAPTEHTDGQTGDLKRTGKQALQIIRWMRRLTPSTMRIGLIIIATLALALFALCEIGMAYPVAWWLYLSIAFAFAAAAHPACASAQSVCSYWSSAGGYCRHCCALPSRLDHAQAIPS